MSETRHLGWMLAVVLASMHCAQEPSGEMPSSERSPLGCEERVADAARHVESVRRDHLACVRDRDCVLIDVSTRCRGACPVAVASSGAAAVERALRDVDATICRDFQADGCPFATPGCVAIEPACQDGTCVGVSPSR